MFHNITVFCYVFGQINVAFVRVFQKHKNLASNIWTIYTTYLTIHTTFLSNSKFSSGQTVQFNQKKKNMMFILYSRLKIHIFWPFYEKSGFISGQKE